MINTERLALMKETAILVNTSRDPVIDETALVAHCQKCPNFRAGLDVFEDEPALKPELTELDQSPTLLRQLSGHERVWGP